MPIKHLHPAPLLILATLVACAGAESTETIHEKDGATASALLAGWSVEPLAVASVHPLANNLKQSLDVRAPDTARKFRLRFDRISMERGYDYLVIQDEWGNELQRITGDHRRFVSRTIRGTSARIVLETDSSVASWGFALSEVRHRGCTHNVPGNVALAPVASCTDLETEIRNLAIAEVRRRFTNNHFGGPIRTLGAPEANQRGTDAPAHSETNVQVLGVDEADIVKTDGNFIYTVAGRQLRVFRSWPAADTTLEHSIDIEGWPKELFLHQGRVVVISGVRGDRFVNPPILPFVRIAPIWWNPEAFTKLTVVDLSNGTPSVVSETLLAGVYSSARRIDGSVRLLLSRQLDWPNIQYYPDGNFGTDTPEFESALEQLEADAIQTVTNRALADWLPTSYRIVNGQRVALPIQCENFLAPTGGDEIGLMAVATVDLSLSTPSVHETSALVQSGQLYQSLHNLYVTSNHQWSCWEDAGTEGAYTYVHKFDVHNPGRTTYEASGGFAGSILNQFSLDEHQGFLRVAATNNRWQAPVPEERSESNVFVFEQSGTSLNVVGQVGPLAPGERIFGARFMGERGFVVTFRQVDPLFTLDLSNPRQPVVLGELKIPGFSTYLHPLDSNHLLTIGNDFELDGRTRNGVALSIFDVSDMRAPVLAHKMVVGTPRSGSEALYNHRAFTMYTPPGDTTPLLGIPFTDYDTTVDPIGDRGTYWNRFESSLRMFRVSANGITAAGSVELAPLYRTNDYNEFGWWYQPNVRRAVFVDRYAFAISDAGMRVVQIDDPSTVVAEVLAPAQFEDSTPAPTLINEDVSATPNVAIPDNDKNGVTSTIELTSDTELTALSVDVDVRHSYRGDLVVTLEHNGIIETLHDRTGGSSDDIKRTYTTERFVGERALGTWTLYVSDHAGWDVGTLSSWTLHATGTAAAGGTTPTIKRTYSSSPDRAIPDNDVTGIETRLEVPEGLRIETLEVTVDVTHSYRGDLAIVLSHDGIDHVLHDRSGGSADDVHLVVDVDAFLGRDARGTWTLRVVDHAKADMGTLDTFGLEITGAQIGR